MLANITTPMTGKLSGSNSGSATSPRSPLDQIQSPKGPKKYDFESGIGLGIVVALEKAEQPNKPILTRNLSRSNEEDYTFVTCHGPSTTTSGTRVYYDDGITRKNSYTDYSPKSRVKFQISPVRIPDHDVDFPASSFLDYCHLCHKKLHGKDIYIYRGEKAFCSTECRSVEIAKDERREKQQRTSKLVASRSNSTRDHVSTNLPYVTNRRIFATGILAA